jgi:hypothetical protein
MIAAIFPLSNSKLRLKPFANEKAYAKFREAGVLMRKHLFLICVLAMPCASWAQSNPASWENLNTLQAGEKIQVVEINSKKVSGTFVNVSDAAISLQEKASQEMVQRQDVRSVKLRKHQHRLRNTLLGAAIGFGAGAGIGAATYHKPQPCAPLPVLGFGVCLNGLGDSRGVHAAVGAAIGLVGGTVVGAVWPSHKTIYRVKSQ